MGWYYGYFAVTVTVEDVNEPPVINTGSRTAFTFRGERHLSLYTYRATDPERGTITWSVSGTDGDDFAVSGTGVLTFRTPAQLRNPGGLGPGQRVRSHAGGGGQRRTAGYPSRHRHGHRREREGRRVSGRDNYTVSENGDLPGTFFTAVDPEGGRTSLAGVCRAPTEGTSVSASRAS